jgi:hypothetical protein
MKLARTWSRKCAARSTKRQIVSLGSRRFVARSLSLRRSSRGRSREGIPAAEGGLHAASLAQTARESLATPHTAASTPSHSSQRATRGDEWRLGPCFDPRRSRIRIATPMATFARAVRLRAPIGWLGGGSSSSGASATPSPRPVGVVARQEGVSVPRGGAFWRSKRLVAQPRGSQRVSQCATTSGMLATDARSDDGTSTVRNETARATARRIYDASTST